MAKQVPVTFPRAYEIRIIALFVLIKESRTKNRKSVIRTAKKEARKR